MLNQSIPPSSQILFPTITLSKPYSTSPIFCIFPPKTHRISTPHSPHTTIMADAPHEPHSEPSEDPQSSSASSALRALEEKVMAEVVSFGADVSTYERTLASTLSEESSLLARIHASLGLSDLSAAQAKQRAFESHLDRTLAELPALYQVVSTGAGRLDKRISETRAMADVVSKKVREIDLSRTRALQALEMVQSIVDLKQCVAGAEKAISAGAFEDAAGLIERYRGKEAARAARFQRQQGLAPRFSSNERSEEVLHISGSQESLRQCEEKLKRHVLQELDAAVAARDDRLVLSCCAIFAKLGMQRRAISRFMEYQCALLRADVDMEIELSDAVAARGLVRRPSDASRAEGEGEVEAEAGAAAAPKNYVDLLTYLFNKVAAVIQQSAAVIRARFGASPFFQATIVAMLHAECDVLACRILSLFLNKRRINERVQLLLEGGAAASREEMFSALHKAVTLGLSVYDADNIDSMIALDATLDELALMSQHTVSYDRYVKGKSRQWVEAMREANEPAQGVSSPESSSVSEAASATEMPAAAAKTSVPESNEYDKILQEIAGLYAILEEKFMRAAVYRAMDQEIAQSSGRGDGSDGGSKSDSEEVAVSSVVTDTFYIMQKSSQRALATGNVDSACATVNNIVKILEDELGAFIKQRCESLPTEATTLSQQGQAHFERIRETVMIDSTVEVNEEQQLLAAPSTILNSCSLCLQYTKELQSQIEAEAEEVLLSSTDKAKLQSCGDSLMETINLFYRRLDAALNTFASTLKAPIQAQVASTLGASNVTFDLTEADFERIQSIDPNIRPLLAIIGEVLVSPFRRG